VTAGWSGGPVRPALQLRLPLLGTPKQAVRWTLAAGLRVVWGEEPR